MGYLEEHLKKYPLMQIEDKIKLLMQGTLGPAHLINDKEQVKKRIYQEYEQIKDLEYDYDLVEHISDKFVRVYLKPYYEMFNTLLANFKHRTSDSIAALFNDECIEAILKNKSEAFVCLGLIAGI